MTTKLTIYLALISLLLGGCTKEREIERMSSGTTMVTLAFSGNAIENNENDPLGLFDEERAIRSIRIYVFNRYPTSGDAHFERVIFEGGITAFNSYNYKIKINVHYNKEFYVIVNEPWEMSAQLEQITSVSELKSLSYEFATYFNNDLADAAFCYGGDGVAPFATFTSLPMFGELTGQDVKLANNQDITIPVHRSLARVDLKLKNESKEVVTFNANSSFRYTTYPTGFFSELARPTNLDNMAIQTKMYDNGTKVISTTAFDHVLSFYTPTRQCPTDDERLEIYLNKVLYGTAEASYTNPIVIKKITDGGTVDAIERNMVYTVNGSIKSDFQNDWKVDVTIAHWEDVILDDDIGNPSIILLEVSDDKESLVQNESQIDVLCKIGNEDIYIGDDTGEIAGGYHPLGNIILDTRHFPKWLKSAEWVSTMKADGKYPDGRFTFERQHPGTLEEALKSYTIKVKCANVTQLIVLKYIQTSGDIEGTIADWTDIGDIEGDLSEGKDILFTSPKAVWLDEPQIPDGFASGPINYSSNEEVHISLINTEGAWERIKDATDFNTKFATSPKPTWLTTAIFTPTDSNSGVFNFSTTSIDTNSNHYYIIKLQSQNIVHYMKIGQIRP